MKIRILIIGFGLFAVTASAQIDPGADGVGIYADLGGMTNQVELEVGVPLEVYLLLTRPSGTGSLAGWECGIILPDNVSVWGWNVPYPGAIAMIDPPSCLAAWPDGVPFQDVNLLVKFIIVPLDSEPAQFYITGPVADNPARLPIYLDLPIDGTQEIPMVPYPRGEAMASFTVNPQALALASVTWGEVKALYR